MDKNAFTLNSKLRFLSFTYFSVFLLFVFVLIFYFRSLSIVSAFKYFAFPYKVWFDWRHQCFSTKDLHSKRNPNSNHNLQILKILKTFANVKCFDYNISPLVWNYLPLALLTFPMCLLHHDGEPSCHFR